MNKERAREYLIKSKLYRFTALVFACVGVLVFVYMYAELSHSDGGGFFNVLHDPSLIIVMIFPFVPAIVLSYMAQRAEKKLRDILKEP